jgi:hypothetical protein
MQRQSIHTTIKTLTDTKSLESTEDTYFVNHNGEHLTLMVADGALQRLKTTGSMKPILKQYGDTTKPGQYASSLIRDVTAELSITAPHIPIQEIPLAANQRLNDALKSVYGDVSRTAVTEIEPTLASKLQEDPRFVRLILPACCITIARLDLKNGTLDYTHGGDTALFLLYRDGHTVQATPDQMAQHDNKVRRQRLQIMKEHNPKDLAEFRALTSDAQVLNINNGIYHNYEDEHGNIDPSVGVGIINGMPQLESYLINDTISLDNLEGVVATSDGMFWPAPLDETDEQAENRVNHMGNLIRQHGLKGYLQALHTAMLSDEYGEPYRNFVKLDDATAIHVQLERK